MIDDSSFRPLAGLSCINLLPSLLVHIWLVGLLFPSPRGVELHKPGISSHI